MTSPRTAAGRALLQREAYNSRSFALITAAAILAIEAEVRADLAEKVRGALDAIDGDHAGYWDRRVAPPVLLTNAGLARSLVALLEDTP